MANVSPASVHARERGARSTFGAGPLERAADRALAQTVARNHENRRSHRVDQHDRAVEADGEHVLVLG